MNVVEMTYHYIVRMVAHVPSYPLRKVKDWDLPSHPHISVMWLRNDIPTLVAMVVIQ